MVGVQSNESIRIAVHPPTTKCRGGVEASSRVVSRRLDLPTHVPGTSVVNF